MAKVKVGSNIWVIGTADYMYSFFSTIAVRLEPEGWGTRFPVVQDTFAEGELPASESQAALEELAIIREELSQLPPSAIVWDHNDRTLEPPWGDKIDPSVSSLANYFITYDGNDLFNVLNEAIEYGGESGKSVFIEPTENVQSLVQSYRRK